MIGQRKYEDGECAECKGPMVRSAPNQVVHQGACREKWDAKIHARAMERRRKKQLQTTDKG